MKKKAIVLGAGITGLTFAWKLLEKGYSVELVESNNYVGGLASSFKHKEFLLDYGPHKIYTQMPHILNEIKNLLGEDMLSFTKKSKVRLLEKYFEYPLDMKELIFKINPLISFKCGLSYFSTLVRSRFVKNEDKSYEDYIVNRFGKTVYDLAFRPLAEKTWGNPKELSSDMARTRISMPNLIGVIRGLITGKRYKPEISAKIIHYPRKAIIQLSEKMAGLIKAKKGKIHLGSRPKSINLQDNIFDSVEFINTDNKKMKVKADYLVSTIPLKSLCSLFNPKLPADFIKVVESLAFRNLILLYVVLNKEKVMKDHYSFFPESKFIFNRLSEQKNLNKLIFPEEKTVLTADIPCGGDGEIWTKPDKEIFEIALKSYKDIGLLNRDDVDSYFTIRLEEAYPKYDLLYKQKLNKIITYLDKIGNFMTLGRQGIFNYNNMDHCMDMAIIAAEHISNNRTKAEWLKRREYFNTYKIVD